MAASCVNIASKEFKEAVSKHKIDKGYLEDYFNEYNENSSDGEFLFPSDKEIERHFGLNKSESDIIYRTQEEYQIAKNNWEQFNVQTYPNLEVAVSEVENLKRYFNSNDIKLYKNTDGKFVISILKPTNNNLPSIENKPIKKEQKKESETIRSIPESFLKEAKRRENFNTSKVLVDSDKKYLAQQVSNIFSKILDELQGPNSEQAIREYLGDIKFPLDITKMKRSNLINLLDPVTIFTYIRDTYLDPYNREGLTDEVLEQLDEAYNNFDLILELAAPMLRDNEGVSIGISRSMDYIEENTLEEDFDDPSGVFAEFNPEESLREGWQTEFRSQRPSNSLSTALKKAFNLIEFTDENGEVKRDKYGFPETVDSDEIYNVLITNLSTMTDIAMMDKALEELQKNYPWASQIKELISKEPIRSQFFSAMRKHNTSYTIVNRTIGDKDTFVYKHQDLNTSDAITSFMESIEELFITEKLPIVKSSEEGKVVLNQERVQKLINRITELQTSKLFYNDSEGRVSINKIEYADDILKRIKSLVGKNGNSVFTEVLGEIGIVLPDKIVKQVVESIPESSTKASNTQASKILDLVREILENSFKAQGETAFSPTRTNSSRYKKLINFFENQLTDYVEASIYENGKMYYAYNNPGYLTTLITKFKTLSDEEFMKFIDKEYKQSKWFSNKEGFYSPWLRKLTEGSKEDRRKMRNLLNHEVLIHINKVDYSNQTELEYTMALLTEYFSGGNSNFARYHVPILADKPSGEFIRFYRYTGETALEDIVNELSKLAEQELARIKTVTQRAKDPNILKIDYFDLKEGNTLGDDGAKFHFLPSLNKYLKADPRTGEFLDQRFSNAVNDYINNDDLTDFHYILDVAKEEISIFMESQFNDALEKWEKLGLLENGGKTHLSNLLKSGNIIDQLRNYYYNSYLASANIIQLTATDLAYYKNVEDFQKRFAQVHAPATKGNIYATDENGKRYTDGIERSIYIEDDIIQSEIKDQVKLLLEKHLDTIRTEEGKERHRKYIKEILKLYDEANFLDGQGYTTISGMRKKFGIFGRWTNEMETAYSRIKEGNFNLSDIDVIFQPLKPFMFTNTHVNSGVGTIETLKVPTMHKNSEYLLLLTSAIISGSRGQKTKLAAIHDFMEENNIDLIQSVSAVKTGSQGAINLSGDLTYNKVREILDKKTLLNEKDAFGKRLHNPQRVHQNSFEDYGIQQEVPEHLVDHHALFGSQIRKLITSDIPVDATFNLGGTQYSRDELLNQYQENISKNIKEDYNQLMKELGLSGENVSKFRKNKALSDLLSAEIRSSAKYSSDLLRAVAVNPNGDFTIPLSDPIHAVQIQQLLSSIIKSRITKQKIKGGPAVQVSAFGLDSELKIKFSEDGSHIEYMEAAIPPPSEELRKALTVNIRDTNGKIIDSYIDINKRDIEGRLIYPNELREIIGYRIPTEGKYSMIPIKVTKFLPPNAGSGVMLPREVTLLTGSDFDIDKMYLMLPEFRVITHNMEAAKKTYEVTNKAVSDVLGATNEISVEDIVGTSFGDWFNSLTEQQRDSYKLDVPLFKKVKYKDKSPSNNRAARNNRVLEITKAILTNPSIQDQYFNPGSFDIQKRTARIANIARAGALNTESNKPYTYEELNNMSLNKLKKIESQLSVNNSLTILDPTTQVYFHEQNMLAKKIIGIAANHNSSHAMVQHLGNVNFTNLSPIAFDNINYTGIISNVIALDGTTYISKTLAGILAASVDAVKDPVLKYLNFNTNTIGPAMVLLRMGHDMDSVGLFMSLPIIEELCNRIALANNNGFISSQEVTNKMITELGAMLGFRGVEGAKLLKTRLASIQPNQFTKNNMFNIITGEATGNPQSIDSKLDALLLFRSLLDHAKALRDITTLTKVDTQSVGVGPSIADTLVNKVKVEKFLSKKGTKEQKFSDNAYEIFERLPMLGAFYNFNMQAFDNIFRDHFPQLSEDYSNAISLIGDMTKTDLNVKDINLILNDLTTFKFTTLQNFEGNKQSRKDFLFGFPKQVEEFKKDHPELADNKLVKSLVIKQPGFKNKAPFAVVNAVVSGGMTSNARNKIQSDWDKLLENEKTKQFALDLIRYSFYRAGFEYSPTTPMHLTTLLGKTSLNGYIDFLRKDFPDSNIFDSVETMGSRLYIFINQFLRNHTTSNKWVKTIDYAEIANNIVKGNMESLVVTPSPALDIEEDLVTGSIVKVVDGETEYIYIAGKSELYPTSKLGVRFSTKEYDAYDTNIESVLPDNKKIFISTENPNPNNNSTVYNSEETDAKIKEFEDLAGEVIGRSLNEGDPSEAIVQKVADVLGVSKEEIKKPFIDDANEVLC